MISKIKKMIHQILQDAVIWFAIYCIVVSNGFEIYATNGLRFFIWVLLILMIPIMLAHKAREEYIEKVRADKKDNKFEFMKDYYRLSTVFEALAMAIVGLPITAFAYIILLLISEYLRMQIEMSPESYAAMKDEKQRLRDEEEIKKAFCRPIDRPTPKK